MNKRKLKEEIEKIEITYDYDKVYSDLYNIIVDYMNETQDWQFEYLFEDIIDYEIAEEIAKRELDNGGLLRLYYFLGDANLNNSYFKIDGYGNLTDVEKSDFEYIKETILEELGEE
jgi:hypothetical protein